MTENYPTPLDGLHAVREQAQLLVDARTQEVTQAIQRLKESVETLEAYDRAITAVISAENKAAHPKPPKAPKAPKGEHRVRKVSHPLVGMLPPLGAKVYDALPEDGYPLVVEEIAARLGISRQRAGVSASHLARHHSDLVERLDEDTYRRIVQTGGAS
jgi:hypothetical protein